MAISYTAECVSWSRNTSSIWQLRLLSLLFHALIRTRRDRGLGGGWGMRRVLVDRGLGLGLRLRLRQGQDPMDTAHTETEPMGVPKRLNGL